MPRSEDARIARAAIRLGLASRAQVDECLAHCRVFNPPPPLAYVLIERGYVTAVQLARLERTASAVIEDPLRDERTLEDLVLAQLAIRRESCERSAIDAALERRRQAIANGDPNAPRLVTLLEREGSIARAEARDLWQQLLEKVLICYECRRPYHLRRLTAGRHYDCPRCKGPLEVPRHVPPKFSHPLVGDGADTEATDGGAAVAASGAEAPGLATPTPPLEDEARPGGGETAPSAHGARHPAPRATEAAARPGTPAPPSAPAPDAERTPPAERAPRLPSVPELRPGAVLGRYRLERGIGEGGMGTVFAAKVEDTDNLVALKILPPEFARNANYLERFNREAHAAARLRHANIVGVLSVGRSGPYHFIAMQLVDGESLHDRIQSGGRLAVREAAEMMRKVCDGLGYAHDHGIIHRDIKPENILISRDGRVMITDFGLARLVETDSVLTRTGQCLGTPHYMPVEQWEGDRQLDQRADLYSMGVTFYYALAGRRPFEAPTMASLFTRIASGRSKRLTIVNEEVPPALARIIHKLMSLRSADRYETCEQAREELDRFLAQLDALEGMKDATDPERFANLLVPLPAQEDADPRRRTAWLGPLRTRRLGARDFLDNGIMAYNRGDLRTAEDCFARIAADSRRDYRAHYYLGRTHAAAGDHKTAVADFGRAIKLLEGLAEAHYHRGLSLIAVSRFEQALQDMQTTVGLKEDFPDARFQLGYLRSVLGDKEGAVGEFRRGLQLYPQDFKTLGKLTALDRELGRPRDVVRTLRRFLRESPAHREALDMLCEFHRETGRERLIPRAYRRFLAARPADGMVHALLLREFLRLQRLGEAIDECERYLSLRPDRLATVLQLGSIHLERMDLPRAVDAFERAVRLDPRAKLAHEKLARLYREMGRDEQADAEFQWLLQQELEGG